MTSEAAGRQVPHGRLKCDRCQSIEPYRRFRAALAAAGAAPSEAAAPGAAGDGRAGDALGGCPGCGCNDCG